MKPEIGDLVEVGGIWNLYGVVIADDTASWVIRNHYDVSHCIVNKNEIKRIIRKRFVPKKWIKAVQYGGMKQ